MKRCEWLLMCVATGLAIGWPGLAAAAAPVGTATIVQSFTLAIREASKLGLAEGVRLLPGDIVETTPQSTLVRLELADGSLLDLGPSTKLMLAPTLAAAKPGERARRTPLVYVLQGWVKLTGAAGVADDKLQLTSPGFELSGASGRVVLSVQPGAAGVVATQAFAESGPVNIVDVGSGGVNKLKTGGFFSRNGVDKAVALPRPPADFIQHVPRAFLDSLPPLAERFKTRDVVPKTLGAVTYAEVQAWLTAEPALRTRFLTQWRVPAQAGEFRQGLQANMRLHPEWDRIVNPDKYKPKPPPAKPPTQSGYPAR